MRRTSSTPEYVRWLDALAALDAHDRACQTCMASMILQTHLTTPRCAEGDRLHGAQFQIWRCWYEVRTNGTDARIAQVR